MLAAHRQRGGIINHLLDVGAADGELTQAIKQIHGQPIQQITAIEPNTSKDGPLQSVLDHVAIETFDSWHESNQGVKVDFMLASHVAYYFDDPTEGVRRMASHLNDNGTLGIILADWRSGRSQLLHQANALDLSKKCMIVIIHVKLMHISWLIACEKSSAFRRQFMFLCL